MKVMSISIFYHDGSGNLLVIPIHLKTGYDIIINGRLTQVWYINSRVMHFS